MPLMRTKPMWQATAWSCVAWKLLDVIWSYDLIRPDTTCVSFVRVLHGIAMCCLLFNLNILPLAKKHKSCSQNYGNTLPNRKQNLKATLGLKVAGNLQLPCWILASKSRVFVSMRQATHGKTPQILVFGCALPSAPPASSCLLLPPSASRSHTTYSHTTHNLLTHTTLIHTKLPHAQLVHTQLVHTQLAHTHTTPSHTTPSHTHNLLTHNSFTHSLPTHNLFTHNLLAGVALGDIDIDLHFVWQAWHLWHWAGSGGTLGPPATPRSFCVAGGQFGVAGVALGDIQCHLAWQVWHLVTLTLPLRGRQRAYGIGLSLVTRLVRAVVCHLVGRGCRMTQPCVLGANARFLTAYDRQQGLWANAPDTPQH